jgi:hypothetical protein
MALALYNIIDLKLVISTIGKVNTEIIQPCWSRKPEKIVAKLYCTNYANKKLHCQISSLVNYILASAERYWFV